MRFAFNKTLLVSRLVSTPDKKKESYELLGEIQGSIMSIKAEDTLLSEGNPADMLKLYTESHSDIKETDKLECEGETYIVKAIRKLERGALTRIEAIIYKTNN
jgi:hypothetical protein